MEASLGAFLLLKLSASFFYHYFLSFLSSLRLIFHIGILALSFALQSKGIHIVNGHYFCYYFHCWNQKTHIAEVDRNNRLQWCLLCHKICDLKHMKQTIKKSFKFVNTLMASLIHSWNSSGEKLLHDWQTNKRIH